ncbi:hypothetical protein MmTuc01_2804 [Methanosarcina mazei Tuc01]|uniref:Uncharacterized protein n=1 Tax=Methanosarcina mazei Tuc01 TaxID=1236903 RepID=M1QCW1_METMZ|nr:hypothetical protein MmTuc01_2804 [Methanosarcina mazei Tuc01]
MQILPDVRANDFQLAIDDRYRRVHIWSHIAITNLAWPKRKN